MSLQYNTNLVNFKGHFYIFEIVVNTSKGKKTFRKIKNDTSGILIDFSENISKDISKIKITVIDFNNINSAFVIKKNIENYSDILVSRKNLIVKGVFIQDKFICYYNFLNL